MDQFLAQEKEFIVSFQNDYCYCDFTFNCDVWSRYECKLVDEVLVASTLCGGISSTNVDDHIEKLVADFKGEVETKLNQQFTTFKAVEATQQVVLLCMRCLRYRWLE